MTIYDSSNQLYGYRGASQLRKQIPKVFSDSLIFTDKSSDEMPSKQ